jgi:hypothetical protein
MVRQMKSLTDAQKAEVETLAAVLTAEQVADYFGIGRRTFYSMMERDEEIVARYKWGKARAIGAIAQGLINKARSGDTTSMIFFLKTQAGWRETSRIEHQLPEESEDLGTDARERLKDMINAIAERNTAWAEIEARDNDVGRRAAQTCGTDGGHMRQSRLMSLVETLANVCAGFGLAVITQMVVLPVFGIQLSLSQNVQISLIFTVVSLLRGYVLRRLFDRLGRHP